MFDNATQSESDEYSGTISWFCINILIITVAILGNLLTISAILSSRKLSAVVANQFVFSLAVSDLFVGLTIPYHMAFYTVPEFGTGKLNCLLRFVLISFACSSSISNLLVIAADRYVAIVYPLHYTRIITRKSALVLTMCAWFLSFTVSIIPLIWNDWKADMDCDIIEVIPNNYMNFVVSPMFVLIWVMMLLLYARICQEAAGHAKRMRNSVQNMVAMRDSKSYQVILTILGCFTICWLPYFIIILYSGHYRPPKNHIYYEIAFNLAVANSGMNPIIYAWKNATFRASFLHFLTLRCKPPKPTFVMLLILGCFTVCWLPYFVTSAYSRFQENTSKLFKELAFNLAAANSGMNPIIYAWKNESFRSAFLQLTRCQSKDFTTNHVPKIATICDGTLV